MECSWTLFGILAFGGTVAYIGLKFLMERKKKNMLKKWDRASKDKVILHGMYGGNKYLPTPSPFVLKLETYLRMANIPYEVDKSDIFGPKGKAPWISFNGHNLADSQMIIELLGKKFDKNYVQEYSKEDRALGFAIRVMLEEYVYWCGVVMRFQFSGKTTFQQVRTGEVSLGSWLIFQMIAPTMRSMAWSQGVGRHTEQEVLKIMHDCLHTVSKLLGSKRFLLGDKMTEEDCSAFGVLAASVFIRPSPFEKEFSDEWKNIKQYCVRIKEMYWPDWEKSLQQ